MASYPEVAWDIVHQRPVAVSACIDDMPFAVVALASCSVEACRRRLAAYLLGERGFARGLLLPESRQWTLHQPRFRSLARAQAH